MATGPFYDTMPGPERRDTLNEMWGIWQDAIGNIIKGDKGWSPLLQGVIDGNRLVLQLYDWTGGEGDKPTQTGYLGVSGYVPNISDALDFRGPQGIQGLPGPSNSLEIGTVQSGAVADASITGSSPSQVLNLVLPKGDTGSPGNAATVEVGTVTTGNPGTSAQVTNTGSAQSAVFNFVIPRGEDGSGSGDMLKSEYDSVGDGVVNAARVAPWAGITGKPIVIAAGASQEDARAAISAVSSSELSTGLSNKVDKVAGKGLSTEDFTTAEKTKLSGVATGATANYTDTYLLNRENHTGAQAISTITNLQNNLDSKQPTLISGTNIKTINGSSILGSGDVSITSGSTIKELHFHTTNTTYTVPAGQKTVRFYIGGRGGNGASEASGNRPGGGGGGFAFGDLAVNVGDVVALGFAAGIATVKLNGVTMGTANVGGDGVAADTGSPAYSGTGGTASIHSSVTNGGAYPGGKGGDAQTNSGSAVAGGGSCGSPLGAGFAGGSGSINQSTPGGAGIGASGGSANGTSNGGGGAGEAGAQTYGGGSGPNGASRGVTNYFADPLLRHATGPRTVGNGVYGYAGCGGAPNGAGGDFGGGGSGGGRGGLMGGGGGGLTGGGNGGYGGGGGGGNPGGTGGGAFGFLYY